MSLASRILYPTTTIVNRLVKYRQSDVASDYVDDKVNIVRLEDPSFDYGKLPLTAFDGTKPLPIPDVSSVLGLTRYYTDSEKEQIWHKLQQLQYNQQYNKHTQLETYKDTSMDLGVYLFDFEYIKGSVRAK